MAAVSRSSTPTAMSRPTITCRASAAASSQGVRVTQGQVVGYLGQTGLATGPHLHYEVIINGNFVDPMAIKLARTREFDGQMLAPVQEGARTDRRADGAGAGRQRRRAGADRQAQLSATAIGGAPPAEAERRADVVGGAPRARAAPRRLSDFALFDSFAPSPSSTSR